MQSESRPPQVAFFARAGLPKHSVSSCGQERLRYDNDRRLRWICFCVWTILSTQLPEQIHTTASTFDISPTLLLSQCYHKIEAKLLHSLKDVSVMAWQTLRRPLSLPMKLKKGHHGPLWQSWESLVRPDSDLLSSFEGLLLSIAIVSKILRRYAMPC